MIADQKVLACPFTLSLFSVLRRLAIPPLTVKNRSVCLFGHVRLIGRIRYACVVEKTYLFSYTSYSRCSVQNNHLCMGIQQKMAIGQAEWNPNLPTWQVMFLAEFLQCVSPLFYRVAGQVKVLAGQVNFRGSLPPSASNVLKPMLHPEVVFGIS